MQTKMMTVTEMGDTGKGLALIARLSEVDHDGDTYAPGAFTWKEQWVPLLPAHDRSAMQFGKARLYEDGDAAYAELHLNLETQAGRDWHAALKFDLATGKSVQEWSFGYDAVDFEYRANAEQRIRVLKQLDVHEVSTVVRGAGRGTGTLSMKARNAALKEGRFGDLIADLGEIAGLLKADPAMMSETGRKQLSEIHAAIGQVLVPAISDEEKALIEQERIRFLTSDARARIKSA